MKILKMVYRRKDYENHRDDILLKLQKRKEQQMENINAAYREIYEKWGFNDHMIKSLLDDYTVTEILS